MQRVIIMIIAIALFLSTIAGVVLIVISANQSDSTKNDQDAVLQQLRDQEKQKQSSTKLEGTKMADFTPIATISELKSTDTKVGTGVEVKKGDLITAHYTGAVAATGIVFQSSLDTGSPFDAKVITAAESSDGRGLISGWVQGIPGMKVGGKRRLYIPASLAYGENPPTGSNIPANADLVFDIELVKIGE